MSVITSTTDLAHERMVKRIESVRVVFQKVVRIITGRNSVIVVEQQPHMDAPGWTDGRDIFLNGKRIEKVLRGQPTDEDFRSLVLRTKGLIYHEGSHILFTPRKDDLCVQEVLAKAKDEGFIWWWAFNALEDQRIETLFTSNYRPAVKYFLAAVMEWIVKNPQATNKSHLLLHGRRYVPEIVRQRARGTFVDAYGTTIARQADDIIDRYLTVTFPGQSHVAWQCVREMVALLRTVNPTVDPNQLPPQPSEDNNPGQTPKENDPHVITKGAPSKDRQKEAQEQRKKDEDQGQDPAPKPQTSEESDDDAEGDQDAEGNVSADGGDAPQQPEWDKTTGDDDDQDGDPQQGTSGQGDDSDTDDDDAEGDGGVGDGDSDSGSDADADADGDGGGDGDEPGQSEQSDGQGEGIGVGEHDPAGTPGTIEDLAREILDQVMDSKEMTDDLDSLVDTLRDLIRNDDGLSANKADFVEMSTPGDARKVVRKTVTVLSQIRLDLEAEKVHRQLTGRYNMRRVMAAQPHDMDLFDQWNDTGEDAGGVEAVVLIDMSISMSSNMGMASTAMWTVKRAMQELDIPCTVLGYSNEWYTLYRPAEKVSRTSCRRFNAIGGTVPLGAIQKAHSILTKSKHTNRVLVSITDGAWGTPDEELAPYMADIHKKGGTSLLLGVGGYEGNRPIERFGLHHHNHGTDLGDIADIPKAMEKMVASVLRQAARNQAGV